MWIAVNKDGRPKLFEMPPKRFHEGPTLSPELVGFNDAVSVGNDEYSFWAVQEFCNSNRIDDRKHLGYNIMTENEEEGHKVWCSYVPKCVENMTWEDEPIEIEISLRPQSHWKPSKEQIVALRWVLNNVPYNKHKEEISELLEQVKKLREEWL